MRSDHDQYKSADPLFEESEALLSTIEQLGAAEGRDESLFSTEPPSFFEEPGAEVPISYDARSEIRLSADEMTAWASFFPPGPRGLRLDPSKFSQVLLERGINHSVHWEEIERTIFRVNTEHVEVSDFVIANGEEPVSEVPDIHVLEERFAAPGRPARADQSDRVDYRDFSPFVLAAAGDRLAALVPGRPGRSGRTVTDKVFPFPVDRRETLAPGKNVQKARDGLYASCDGRVSIDEKGRISVSEILVVRDGVDFRTGHIDFPGDVYVAGDVMDGFRINSAGSIFCESTLDASVVGAKGDLSVQFGLIGRKRGSVRVGGTVTARFIENCYVEADRGLDVRTSILNSAVLSLAHVRTGSRGVISGGRICAADGVSAGVLGNSAGLKTEIICGVSYKAAQKLEWLRDRTVDLGMKLNAIDRRIREGDDRAGAKELRNKLALAIARLQGISGDTVSALDQNENASVRIAGTVYPGVYIEICRVGLVIDRRLMHVRFSLDKKAGKVRIQPLS